MNQAWRRNRGGAGLPLDALDFGRFEWSPMAAIVGMPDVANGDGWRWDDADWMRVRSLRHRGDMPLAFYRLDARDWYHSRFAAAMDWEALMQELVPYVADLGFTHVVMDDLLLAQCDDTIRGVVETSHIAGVGVVVAVATAQTSLIERCRRLHIDGVELRGDDGEAVACRLFADDGEDVTLGFRQDWRYAVADYLTHSPEARSRHHASWVRALTPAPTGRAVLAQTPPRSTPLGEWRQRVHGDDWQRFASLRAMLGLMWAMPGEKWLAMGVELGQTLAESLPDAIHWPLLFESRHAGMLRMIADLNRLYVNEPALQIRGDGLSGFEWLVPDDDHNSVVIFLRHAESGHAGLVCVSNFQARVHRDYRFGVPADGRWREIFNSDSMFYAGSNVGNGRSLTSWPVPSHGHSQSLIITVPPMATLFLRHEVWYGDTP